MALAIDGDSGVSRLVDKLLLSPLAATPFVGLGECADEVEVFEFDNFFCCFLGFVQEVFDDCKDKWLYTT